MKHKIHSSVTRNPYFSIPKREQSFTDLTIRALTETQGVDQPVFDLIIEALKRIDGPQAAKKIQELVSGSERRGVGRPSKTETESDTPRRGPGRPPKVKTETESDTPSRGPGRPPKKLTPTARNILDIPSTEQTDYDEEGRFGGIELNPRRRKLHSRNRR